MVLTSGGGINIGIHGVDIFPVHRRCQQDGVVSVERQLVTWDRVSCYISVVGKEEAVCVCHDAASGRLLY